MNKGRSLLLCVLVCTSLWCSYWVGAVPTDKWPALVRGKDQFIWALTRTQRLNGLSFVGANERLRWALSRLLAGEPVRITALGGSITLGDLRVDGLPWPDYVFNFMQDHYGPQVQGTNGAVGGTRSMYMSACYNMHAPEDTDIFILEYSVNDATHDDKALLRAQERLVRKLLGLKKKPAVIMAHSLSWWLQGTANWWNTAEVHYDQLSHYYRLPSVSLKSCCFQDLLANKTGFDARSRAEMTSVDVMDPNSVMGRGNISFFWDPAHLDSLTGARSLAELVLHLFQTTIAGLKTDPFLPEEQHVAVAPLPPPLYENNYESLSDRCFIGSQFLRTVTKTQGFDWVNEQKEGRARWGMVAHKPGSLLHVTVDSRSTYLKQDIMGSNEVAVLLTFLRSYSEMGEAEVTCVSGCTCKPALLQGHTIEHHSQAHLSKLHVTQAQQCTLEIKVLESTQSGGFKMKLMGVVISEEAGQPTLDTHQQAFDTASSRSLLHTRRSKRESGC